MTSPRILYNAGRTRTSYKVTWQQTDHDSIGAWGARHDRSLLHALNKVVGLRANVEETIELFNLKWQALGSHTIVKDGEASMGMPSYMQYRMTCSIYAQ